jgi:hypothetical protein
MAGEKRPLTPAELAYLAAFDIWLRARDKPFVDELRGTLLEELLRDAGVTPQGDRRRRDRSW